MAQQCKCDSQFISLKEDIAKNYAGFKDKVSEGNEPSYDAFSESILRRARRATKPIYCLGLMKEWMAFFKDGHTQVSQGGKTVIGDSTELIPLTPEKLFHLKAKNGIEGIYYNVDSTYKIAIISSKTDFRDYAGVVLTSKVPEWKPGQVKLEFRQIGDGSFMTYNCYRDHSVQIEHFEFDGKSLNGGAWTKEGEVVKSYNKNTEDLQLIDKFPIQSRKVSDKTLYIGIQSFEVSNTRAVDSVFKINENVLRTTPNLILDVRGNSGGGDETYNAIIPWLYTNPIYTQGAEDRSSVDNINRWEKLMNDGDMPSSTREDIKRLITQLQAHIGQFVPTAADDTLRLDKAEPYPQRIVVLMDGRCASAAEEFLLKARQSKKVTLMGQHTAGVLDYANILIVPFPCMPFFFYYATSRSRRVVTGNGIDNIGIQPGIPLTGDKNWIDEATRFLENR